MNRHEFSKWIICMVAILAMLFSLTACSSPAEDDTDTVEESSVSTEETTLSAEDIAASIRETAISLERSANNIPDSEDSSEFTVTLTMIESAEILIRNVLAEVQDELPEIQQEEVEEVLMQLYQTGILEEEAVFDLENLMYTYVYSGGVLGGVCLQESNDALNTAASSTPVSNTVTNSSTSPQVVVLNGFEDTAYRRDFYEDLVQDWEDRGIGVTVDTDVTVADLTNLYPYDVIVFSMHGSTYDNQPILAINEVPTTDTDTRYAKYLTEDYSIAKVMYLDGTSGYWVLPEFFRNCYGSSGLDQKIIYSEACCFYGCDCYCSSTDTALGQALIESSAEAVIGYYNSVGADYSRDMMKYTLECMFDGASVGNALALSISTYGESDNWEDPAEDKYPAYPVYMGDQDATLVTEKVTVETPTEPEITIPDEIILEEPTIDVPDTEESAVATGSGLPVESTYIGDGIYFDSYSVTVTPDSFYTENGQLMANVGIKDYMYMDDEYAQSMQVGDTLLLADYIGSDVVITELEKTADYIAINGTDGYILYPDPYFGGWDFYDAAVDLPSTYVSEWVSFPVADDAAFLNLSQVYTADTYELSSPDDFFTLHSISTSWPASITLSSEVITEIWFLYNFDY